jgi:hypothetical protein
MRTTSFLIFILCFVTFYIAPVRSTGDSIYTVQTAYSLLHGHWGDLTNLTSAAPGDYSLTPGKDGRPYSLYPVGPPLFAMPFVIAAQTLIPNLSQRFLTLSTSAEIEAITMAFWCAVAAVLIFLLALEATEDSVIAVMATMIFAFCSPILSTATRALWQHGPVVVCFVGTLYLLRLASRRTTVVPLIAVPVALAFICRPTAITIVLITTIYVVLYHRRQFGSFVLVGVSITLVWVAYNWKVWGSPFPIYYMPATYGSPLGSRIDRVFGPLISPSRGLLIFSPVFVLSAVGPLLKFYNRTFRPI